MAMLRVVPAEVRQKGTHHLALAVSTALTVDCAATTTDGAAVAAAAAAVTISDMGPGLLRGSARRSCTFLPRAVNGMGQS